MRRPKAFTSAILAIVVLLGVAIGFLLTPNEVDEPRYNGHSLSHWVNTFGAQYYTRLDYTPEFAAATNAISQIGTNALPFLLTWIQHEPSSRRDTIARQVRKLPIPHALARKLADLVKGTASDKAGYAGASIQILGANAVLAAPSLVRMMRDTNGPETAVRAIFALAKMGEPTFLLLTRALSDTSQPAREYIIWGIYANMLQAVGTNACIPPIISALRDTDPKVRNAAMLVRGRLASQGIPLITAPPPSLYRQVSAATAERQQFPFNSTLGQSTLASGSPDVLTFWSLTNKTQTPSTPEPTNGAGQFHRLRSP